jgi:hypothetical protein
VEGRERERGRERETERVRERVWDGYSSPHSVGRSSHHSYSSLEMPSETHPDVHFTKPLGVSHSNQAVKQG